MPGHTGLSVHRRASCQSDSTLSFRTIAMGRSSSPRPMLAFMEKSVHSLSERSRYTHMHVCITGLGPAANRAGQVRVRAEMQSCRSWC